MITKIIQQRIKPASKLLQRVKGCSPAKPAEQAVPAVVTVAPIGTRIFVRPTKSQPRSGINAARRRTAAFTLMEVLIASGLALLALLIVSALSIYSSRSFVAIANYVDLDQQSQLALDKMSREIRQCRTLIGFSPTSLSLLDADNNIVRFTYQPENRALVGVWNGQTNVYLNNCDSLQFSKYQREVIPNTFDAYLPAYVTDTKLIQVTWVCSRQILGAKANSESVQSAKIVLRNSGNVGIPE